jgi:hypothetical protein
MIRRPHLGRDRLEDLEEGQQLGRQMLYTARPARDDLGGDHLEHRALQQLEVDLGQVFKPPATLMLSRQQRGGSSTRFIAPAAQALVSAQYLDEQQPRLGRSAREPRQQPGIAGTQAVLPAGRSGERLVVGDDQLVGQLAVGGKKARDCTPVVAPSFGHIKPSGGGERPVAKDLQARSADERYGGAPQARAVRAPWLTGH